MWSISILLYHKLLQISELCSTFWVGDIEALHQYKIVGFPCFSHAIFPSLRHRPPPPTLLSLPHAAAPGNCNGTCSQLQPRQWQDQPWLWCHKLVWRCIPECWLCSDSVAQPDSEAKLWGGVSQEMVGELQYPWDGRMCIGIPFLFCGSPCLTCWLWAIYPKDCWWGHCSFTHSTTHNHSFLKVPLVFFPSKNFFFCF